ncbi:amidohydrolase [Conidiobolus coronatus NRRL 28638]|uniref:Amidohydrolase n=1 Tax=Conidiobolus coronatus (strain ATCC 28846 / CBS 209.66 / NRRL 28638) TaxID=796925 RepID=A0A137P3A1_CONC2|nr:amidohydrolase [Conidiobolus coronatus NRRL 28638]|eukprot:KXN69497.1 amidohydrolase [Conidiobolus coronatus NRRL 28638]
MNLPSLIFGLLLSTCQAKIHCSDYPHCNIGLLFEGGTLIDTLTKTSKTQNIYVKDGKINKIFAPGSWTPPSDNLVKFNATDLIITPGLIDLHTHVYYGSTYWGIQSDPHAARSGVTTWNDAGSSGAYTFTGFKHGIARTSAVNVFAFLHIAGTGLTARTGELHNAKEVVDVEVTVATIKNNTDIIKGIKVRMDTDATGPSGIEGIKRAREAADKANVPIMVHIGHGPPYLSDIVPYMKAGDVLTHMFSPFENKILTNDSQILPLAQEMRNKGIIFDVGHGGGSFNYPVAENVTRLGFHPDVISSDLHQVSILGAAQNLPNVLSKFLQMGLKLEDVIHKATVAPANILKVPHLGYLHEGGPADIAVFKLEKGSFEYGDNAQNVRKGNVKLVNLHTFKDGIELERKEAAPPTFWAARDVGLVSGFKP